MIRANGLSRRTFLKCSAGALSLAALTPRGTFADAAAAAESAGSAAGAPIRLSPGVQLFIDDYLVAQQSNTRRVVNAPPTRLDHPIVTAAEDHCYQPYVSVLRDPRTRRFRMWYGIPVESKEGSGSHIASMESENGMDWIRPHRVLEDAYPIDYCNSVLDEGPQFADLAKRYKMAWDRKGVCSATSPDGLKWSATGPQPVIPKTGDIVSLSRDPYRNRYLIIVKLGVKPEDGYKGSTPNAKEGTRRIVGQSVSEDFINWSTPQRIIMPDQKDEGVTEYYSVGNVIARGGLLIGLLKVLRDDLPAERDGKVQGIGYTVLAWTRDGEHWERDRQPFMDRNPQPGTWDRGMTWGDCLLPVEDDVFIYYGGYARGHKVERFKERQLGFARMQRDRFVSRDAGSEGGTLRTPPLLLEGAKLTLNASIKGDLRVRLLDGASAVESAPLKGDSLAHEVQWNSSLQLKGKPVQLEFVLTDARLYGFELIA